VLTAIASAIGCDGSTPSPTEPQALVAAESTVTVDPGFLKPEFLHADSCARRAPFGLRLRVNVSGRRDFFIRSMRFRFDDPFETSAFPEVIPTPSGSEAALAAPLTAPFRGGASLPPSAIPIPGAAPFTGRFVPHNTPQSLPFFLRFGCGVIPQGTLLVITDVAAGSGAPGTLQVRVPVGDR
jgi:hypothetical protein